MGELLCRVQGGLRPFSVSGLPGNQDQASRLPPGHAFAPSVTPEQTNETYLFPALLRAVHYLFIFSDVSFLSKT